MTLSIDNQHNCIECHYAEFHYAECWDYLNVMLSVVMLNVLMLSVVAAYYFADKVRQATRVGSSLICK